MALNLMTGAPGVCAIEALIVQIDNMLTPLGCTSASTWATIKTALQVEQTESGA